MPELVPAAPALKQAGSSSSGTSDDSAQNAEEADFEVVDDDKN
jgi:hypothetical protein